MGVSPMSSTVYLVGAGPGAPELLTLAAKQAIEQAQVILYDGLVNDQILAFAPVVCERICVGKRGNGGAWTQSQIDDLIVECARKYQRVVRLKGGDTAVFARTAEEVDRLEAEGIAYRIVPGLTAALAVSAYAGIPLTHRDWSSGVALVAAQLQNQDGESEAEDQLDWEALARFPGTLVLYMSIASAPAWSQKLLAAGKPSSTPVALVRKCTWPDQEVLECDLGSVAQTLALNQHFAPPVISIIGPLVRFKSQRPPSIPLHQTTVIVTSPQAQAQRLAELLQGLGVSVMIRPALKIEPAPSDQLDAAIDLLDRTDWIVFSSRYCVEYFFERLFARGKDSRRLGLVRIATVGRSTAQALREYGLRADWIASGQQGAEALLDEWQSQARDKRITLVRTPEGKTILADRLSQIAREVHAVDAYVQVPVSGWQDQDQIRDMVVRSHSQGQRVCVTATSSNIARNAWRLLGDESHLVRWVAISSNVARVLQELGATEVVEAREASYESMCQSIALSVL